VIIVSGWLRVAPEDRAPYLAGCIEVMAAARRAPGCLDFHLAADLLDPERINVYEAWASEADVEAFRAGGPSDDQAAQILDAEVRQHTVSASTDL
jgi:quinol monooxygenase YgiN